MLTAHFVFFPDLNNFLAHDRNGGSFDETFEAGQSVKHLVEAAGVPHTEVGRLQVNGALVEFTYLVLDGDRVEVFPAERQYDQAFDPTRFVADNHLGRLAAYLRMLGFDVTYRNDFDDEELAHIAESQQRILLTRDRRLLMRRAVRYGYCPRSMDSYRQLTEVVRRFNLVERITPFRRCLRCNGQLERVEKEAVLDQLEPLTKRYYNEFHLCPVCGQIYWKGSHYERMMGLIERIQNSYG